MSCKNCDCLDCRTERAVDRIKNRANETEDDYMPPVLEAAPIHRPTWRDAEPANEEQAKAWAACANDVIEEYGGKPINLFAFVYLTVGRIHGLRSENRERVALQVERFLRESPSFEIRKGKNGGVFRKEVALLDLFQEVPEETFNAMKAMVQGTPTTADINPDNYTCKGCGNEKLSTQEKSCWKCGREVGT